MGTEAAMTNAAITGGRRFNAFSQEEEELRRRERERLLRLSQNVAAAEGQPTQAINRNQFIGF